MKLRYPAEAFALGIILFSAGMKEAFAAGILVIFTAAVLHRNPSKCLWTSAVFPRPTAL